MAEISFLCNDMLFIALGASRKSIALGLRSSKEKIKIGLIKKPASVDNPPRRVLTFNVILVLVLAYRLISVRFYTKLLKG